MSSGVLESKIDNLSEKVRELECQVRQIQRSQETDGEFLTTAQVCNLLKIHPNTWYGWLKKYKGLKPPMRFGQRGSTCYRKSSVLRFAGRIGKLNIHLAKSLNKDGDK